MSHCLPFRLMMNLCICTSIIPCLYYMQQHNETYTIIAAMKHSLYHLYTFITKQQSDYAMLLLIIPAACPCLTA